MTRRVLGRGLSALLSETPKTVDEEMLEIDLDLIEPNNMQPRTRFDEARLEELAQSIRANGLVQPLLVRRRGGRYQLVAGERRWRAAQRAGLQKIPAVVREIPDEKIFELALIENIQREELNPMEEAHAYKRLIESLNLTQEMLAQRVGRDRSFIANHIRLLKLPNDLQEMVEEEKLSAGHARALLGLETEEAQRSVAKQIIDRSLSVRETERIVKKQSSEETEKELKSVVQIKSDPNVMAAETKLRRRLSTQVRIITNSNGIGGKLEIEFYSMDDLNRLYELMVGSDKLATQTNAT
ncbi:MAG: ParB/RepB/Spo0J family partition protein [Pyrinomonadaceae bacterium]|nr:ParB/RepB/Spo0J family partition protein [Pyrinomonadaceae bacterium]